MNEKKIGWYRLTLVTLTAIFCATLALAFVDARASGRDWKGAPVAAYERMFAQVLADPAVVKIAPWSDADRVAMTAAALQAVMQWESQQAWRPGFELWLRNVHELTPEEIVAVVDRVNAKRSLQIARAVFAQLDKTE